MSGGRAHARPHLLGSAEALGAQHGPRQPTHRRDNARCKARSFRHADKWFRQFWAGCATLPTLRSADAPRAQNATVWRDCPTCTRSNAGAVRYPIPRKVGQQDGATLICFASFSKQARECRRLATLAQELRRSIVLASFVRALVEAGSRCWSADKLSAGSQCRAACAQSRFSVDAGYLRVSVIGN